MGDKKIDVLDLFCGCGGLALGFARFDKGRQFHVLGGIDTDQNACATFRSQIDAPALDLDIRQLLAPSKLKAALRNLRPRGTGPLVVVGGPPCQGFSAHRKKDSRQDERNDLVNVFFSVALGLKPEFIVMENVPEIFDDKHWDATSRVIAKVEEAGYRVRARVHNLSEFGVPQARFRAVIVARRAGRAFNLPAAIGGKPRTVRSAIGHLPALRAGEQNADDPMHVAPAHTKRILDLIESVPKDGGSRRDANRSLLPDCHEEVDGFRDVYGRLAWDKPSISITAKSSTPSCGRFLHPEQTRNISVREAALLQGFPRDFQFSGPLVQRYRQIGNAVSPIFAERIAMQIASDIVQPSQSCEHLDLDVRAPQGRSFTSSIASRKRRGSESTSRSRPTAIDLFAGAGGLSLGLLQSGFDVRLALDNDPDAVTTYRYNLGSHVIMSAAQDISFAQILRRSRLRAGECDLLVGGPPCQGFSSQGRGRKLDDRNSLVGWFAQAVKHIRPKAFLLENVPYLAGKRGESVLRAFLAEVEACGYRITQGIVDASNFEVSQRRQRFIVIGFAGDLGNDYSLPLGSGNSVKNVRDAIGNLPSPQLQSEHSEYANHVASAISEINRLRISFVPEGGGWQDIPSHLQLDCHTKHRGHGHLDVYGRLRWSEPAMTITAHSDSFSRGRYAHPSEDRPLTGRELASLQSFPRWFGFCADKKSVARLVGNAVPPLLAKALIKSISAQLLTERHAQIRRIA